MTDWAAVRALFPGARHQVYLNTASYGLGADPVLAEVREAIEQWAMGTGSWRAWEARAEEARALFARLIGAAPRNVAMLNTLAAAASQVAESLPAPRDGGRPTIVLGDAEFRSNLFPWHKQQRRGFAIREVPYRDGRIAGADLAAAVDETTALVAVSHVQSANGYRTDLSPVIDACRAHGARLFVDGTQSVGANTLPLDGVDFLATHAYKWLLAPRGASFLYVSDERLAEQTPLQPSWRTPEDPNEAYYGGPFAPPQTAVGLDVSLAWPVWQGATRALELILEIGLEAIVARDAALARRFREGLPALGLAPLFAEHESSPIVALRVPDAGRVERALAEERVAASVRAGYLRTSFHFYNDEDDVDRTLHALGRAV